MIPCNAAMLFLLATLLLTTALPLFAQPAPPIKLPFAAHAAGAVATAEVSIPADRVYPFRMTLGFDRANASDRERVARLVGLDFKGEDGKWFRPEPLEIMVRLEIHSTAGPKGGAIVDQVVKIGRLTEYTSEKFSRHFGVIRLLPGTYRVRVTNLAEHPEIAQTPVMLEMYAWTEGNVFYWGKNKGGGRVTELFNKIQKKHLLDNPSSLDQLPDNSNFPSKKRYPKSEWLDIAMPVGVWDGCVVDIFLDGEEKESKFMISRACGGQPRKVYLGVVADLFRE